MSLGAATIDSVAWRSRWRHRSVMEKVVLFGGVVTLALALPPWPTVPLLVAVCLVAARRAGVPMAHLARCARAPAVFIVLASASTMVSVGFDPFRLTLTGSAVLHAIAVGARAAAASLAMLAFASSTPMTTVMTSLRRIGLPAPCVDVIVVMYRLIFVLLESVSTIRQAQVSRQGYTTLRRGLQSAGLLTAAVLTRSWNRAHRLEIGLSGRDFGISTPVLEHTRIGWRFVVISIGVLLAVQVATMSWESFT
ncbi:cobalt ECF transporter T component CbiQ [Gordonia sp. ABSL11-1]|uniref:cobalt ECF transporter T component CbiQ n=1 Tax=Gordonia sp. ABSL11-1 TaxID=3053924 RepID=UPI0025723DC1|nr:cobalt ECF transporter T component CbiQ [Gordonia sp. ABSL11-1]MDL9948486.1 cobalt ECF transporter T component CbiQ [Gordonia sp. ABSL11-1]